MRIQRRLGNAEEEDRVGGTQESRLQAPAGQESSRSRPRPCQPGRGVAGARSVDTEVGEGRPATRRVSN